MFFHHTIVLKLPILVFHQILKNVMCSIIFVNTQLKVRHAELTAKSTEPLILGAYLLPLAHLGKCSRNPLVVCQIAHGGKPDLQQRIGMCRQVSAYLLLYPFHGQQFHCCR